ncbi:DUF4157 domain-containing protein [Sphingobium sp. AP49]|uniref:eCIS core domain-containing protein n=1 Tax=Sphingobium sp. AP49 TaxID=1144307 RepID=UPI00026EDEE6|nr:DUF4157 domain-containing protein [Sphingobium sp. AP49]WHO39146.1 DUF4157 domain-containing protein [Sphingobium sp. AP49]
MTMAARVPVGPEQDPAEQEAAHIAREVSREAAPVAALPNCPLCATASTPCPTCQASSGLIRRSAVGNGPTMAETGWTSDTGAHPLPTREKAYFERRLGTDLSRVRIHRDRNAGMQTRSAGARAMTLGQHIAFAPAAYQPETADGRELIAHELVHTLQDQGGTVARRAPADGPSNRERIDKAIQSKSVGDVKDIQNFGECSDDERTRLIGILLDQGWVGPRDEWALEQLWSSAGDLLAFAALHVEQWNASVERGAELTGLPQVQSFLIIFRAHAVAMTGALLADSEARIKAEMVRYGLSSEVVISVDPGGAYSGTAYSMGSGPATVGLKQSAQLLLDKWGEIHQREDAKRDQESGVDDLGEPIVRQSNAAAWNQACAALKQSQDEREILRMALEARYPILAAFANDESGLRQVAEGQGNSPATALGKASDEHLANIAKVREKVAEDPDIVWKLPPVLEPTKSEMNLESGSLGDGFVRAQVDKVETDNMIVDLALGALALALGLLAALPTGGGSLVAAGAAIGAVGAVATGGWMALAHLREYQFKAAANGTDFDKARAVSAEEPSMFWLALDIIGVAIDLSVAVSVFKSLTPAARALAQAERASQRAAQLAEELREAAEKAGGKSLADRVVASAERMQAKSIEEAVGAAGAKSVEKTVAKAATEQTEGAAKVASSAGGEVAVTRSGIFKCASPCVMLRERYAEQIVAHQPKAGEKSFGERIAGLEAEARAAEKDSAKLSEIASRAAALEEQLMQVPKGGWRSPLASTLSDAEMAAMVKRRGSASFDLTNRAADWHGADEALFKFGAKAETGYRFRLSPEGELQYVRDSAKLPERIFDPILGIFRAPDPAALKVALESEADLVKMATVGAKATTHGEWLTALKKAVPEVSGLSDEALMRVMAKSPDLNHMRGELLEAMAGPGLARYAEKAGAEAEFIAGSRVKDAANRQLTDGVVVRWTNAEKTQAEVLVIGESKAGEGAARGLSKDHASFNDLRERFLKAASKGEALDDWTELERTAVDSLRGSIKRGEIEGLTAASDLSADALRKAAPDQIEAIMRELWSDDMGQIARDFERMMPNAGQKTTKILIDGKEVEVKVSRATTKVAATAPNDVALDAAIKAGEDYSIGVERLDVGISKARLEEIARQLRAEQIKNGTRVAGQ